MSQQNLTGRGFAAEISLMTPSRPPADLEPPRMDVLTRLPIFVALAGKRALVAGGNPQAAWKAELLSAAGAEVHVFAETLGEEMNVLSAHPPRGKIYLVPRRWSDDDFAGRAMAVGCFENDREAAEFAAAARAARVPVNVIDRPAFCDFAFGAIVNRSPLIIGISTDGAAPVFGMAVRAKIEAIIPRGFARWAEAARRWRRAVASSGLGFSGRRSFWQSFSRFAATHPDREPTQADFDGLLASTRNGSVGAQGGAVTLVGAGPGRSRTADAARRTRLAGRGYHSDR